MNINIEFEHYCKNGDIPRVRKLLGNPELDITYNDYTGLYKAGQRHYFNLIKMVLEYYNDLPLLEMKNELMINASTSYNRSPIKAQSFIKYLLSSPKLKVHADIHYMKDKLLIDAINSDNEKFIKYLLSSPKLKEHADIQARNNALFLLACEKSDVDFLQYLLESKKLKKHATFSRDTQNYSCFFYAAHNRKDLDVINYLLNYFKETNREENIEQAFLSTVYANNFILGRELLVNNLFQLTPEYEKLISDINNKDYIDMINKFKLYESLQMLPLKEKAKTVKL